MSSNCDGGQRNSALSALKQRAQVAPTLTEQQANILYTMPMQTVERLEEVLRRTLALQTTLQDAIQTSTESLKEESVKREKSMESLASAEQLVRWLNQAEDFNKQKVESTEEILREIRQELQQDGKKRDEFIRKLSDVERTFRNNGDSILGAFRESIFLTIMISSVIAVVMSVLMLRLMV